MRRREFLLIGLVIAVIFVLAGALLFAKRATFHGTVISPPLPAAPIELTDHHGQAFSLAQVRGKVVVIFFGYTNCPDECPIAMAQLKQVFDILGDDGREIQVLFISTDPARDDAAALGAFLGHFDPTFLGLTGTPEQLAAVWAGYGVVVLDGGQTHSNRFYVLDRAGNLALTFLPDMLADDMASDLKLLLKK